MPDQDEYEVYKTIPCMDCGRDFDFTMRDKAFYEQKGFQEPKRCKPCRQAKKARQAQE